MATIEGLGRTEVGKVLVVGEDLDGKWGSVEVVSPGFQGSDDGKEFPIIDVIVSFCWREQLGEIGARVPIAVRISLQEDGARGIFGSVSGDGEGGSEVREMKDGLGQE